MRSKIHIEGNQPVKHQFDKLAKTVLVTVMVICEKKSKIQQCKLLKRQNENAENILNFSFDYHVPQV